MSKNTRIKSGYRIMVIFSNNYYCNNVVANFQLHSTVGAKFSVQIGKYSYCVKL